MPNIWTHDVYGDLLVRRDSAREWLKDKALRQLFHLGCQGPDFLFYHRFLRGQGKTVPNKLGSLMHKQACGPVLMRMADTIVKKQLAADDPLAVYVAGFMLHHVLDRNMHPYVFCKSGFIKWNHQRFEVILDTIVVKKLLGLDTWANPVWKQIDIGPNLPVSVVELLADVTCEHYPDTAKLMRKQDWQRAYRDMIRAQKLFHDPSGIKRALTFGRIDPFVYKRNDPERDYLNEARASWRHPALENERSTASFWDLWEQALTDGQQVWDALFRYWADSSDTMRRALAAAVGNRSYEHGLDVDTNLDIRYEQPIWHEPSMFS